MSTIIAGMVKNGVVVPQSSSPDGAQVEIRLADLCGTDQPAVEARFRLLAEQWRRETAHHSNIQKKALHPACQVIIGMGESAVPLILAEMKRQPGQWFWALNAISGAVPVAEEQRGKLQETTEAWLERGRQHGYHA